MSVIKACNYIHILMNFMYIEMKIELFEGEICDTIAVSINTANEIK